MALHSHVRDCLYRRDKVRAGICSVIAKTYLNLPWAGPSLWDCNQMPDLRDSMKCWSGQVSTPTARGPFAHLLNLLMLSAHQAFSAGSILGRCWPATAQY